MERELRYIVLKLTDVRAALNQKEMNNLAVICSEVSKYRESRGKDNLIAAVVESDWPEYEPTWRAIEMRVTGMGEG